MLSLGNVASIRVILGCTLFFPVDMGSVQFVIFLLVLYCSLSQGSLRCKETVSEGCADKITFLTSTPVQYATHAHKPHNCTYTALNESTSSNFNGKTEVDCEQKKRNCVSLVLPSFFSPTSVVAYVLMIIKNNSVEVVTAVVSFER